MLAASLLAEPAEGESAAKIVTGRWTLHAPGHWKAELANVIWKAVRTKRTLPSQVEVLLSVAETFPVQSTDVSELWRGAVGRSLAFGHPVYDTLFVELADRLETKVASFDRGLRRRFPDFVRHPKELLV